MPKVVEIEGYRIYVYRRDHMPPHAHVLKDGGQALIILSDCAVLRHFGLKNQQIGKSQQLVKANLQQIKEAWNASNPESKI